MMWKALLLVCLLGTCYITEGIVVELESFDLNLERNELLLRFSTPVSSATFDFDAVTFIDHGTIPVNRYTLTGGVATAVNSTIVSVSLDERDVLEIIILPGLCTTPSSCFLLYSQDLIRGEADETTLPGIVMVKEFVPYPLFFTSFTLDLDTGHLALSFNKNVSASTVRPSALTLYGAANTSTGPAHTIMSAECIEEIGCLDGPSVVLVLSDDDLNTIKSYPSLCTGRSNCFLMFESSLVEDLGGYPIKEDNISKATQVTADATPPNLLGVGLDFSNDGIIYLMFSEAVDPSTFNIDDVQLLLQNGPSRNYTFDVRSVDSVSVSGTYNISTVVAIVADGILDNMIENVLRNLLQESSFSVSSGIIKDYAGLDARPASGLPLYRSDGEEALTLKIDYPFVFDMETQSFRVTFPCAVPDRFAGRKFTIVNNEVPVATQMFEMTDDYYGGYENDLVFYLTDDAIKDIVNLTDIGTTTANTFVFISKSFCDEQGPLLVQATEVSPTTQQLELVAFTVDLSQSKLQLTFDSLLGDVVDVSQITLQKEENSDQFNHTFLGNSFAVLDWRLDVVLSPEDLTTMRTFGIAQSISDSFITVGPNVARDLYGNSVNSILSNSGLQAGRFIGAVEPQPTTLQSFSFNCDSGGLQLTFSQYVYTATLDLTKAMLMNERGDSLTLFDGDYEIEYTNIVDITLPLDALSTIRRTPGFLVSSSHIYLRVEEALVYDINDLLLNVENDTLPASSAVECPCVEGYILNDNMTDCNDVNECLTASGCDQGCNNTVGSYYCYCEDGYYLEDDGHNCTDINECEGVNHNCSQKCVNDLGSFHCECNTTEYVLLSDEKTCMAIDHCNITEHNCSHMCVDDFGYYRCLCPPGQRLMDDQRTCEDVDECTEGTSGCSQNCTNVIGSYLCGCYQGFLLDIDQHWCSDIDECLTNNGGCEQLCNNTPGSFSCHCREGYTLQSDGYHCTADPCNPTLVAPMYGNISCHGDQVTGGFCTFTCQPGFSLMGSGRRECLPNHTWSGEDAYCQRKRCADLAYSDAVVNELCETTFESTCFITCGPGYFNPSPDDNSVTCVVTSEEDNTVEWTTRPTCQEREPCLPSPCQHNAPCSEVETESGIEPRCDCTGTGFSGDVCDVGVVTVPRLPLLTVGTTHKFSIAAQPDSDLTVELVTDVPAVPSRVTFNTTLTMATFTLTPDTPGVFSLVYQLSGTEAFVFNTPPQATIIVPSGDTPDIDDVIGTSCCDNETDSTHTCSNGVAVTFKSTCRQEVSTWPAGTRILQGISFSEGGGLSLPVALRSVTMTTSGLRQLSYSITPYDGMESCRSCVSEEEVCGSDQWDCNCFSTGADSFAAFITRESLAVTYLNAIKDLLPPWMTLEAVGTARTAFNDYSLSVALVDADDLGALEPCRGFYKLSDSDFNTYSVLLYSGKLTVAVGDSNVEYTPQGDDVICIAVSLCDGTNSPVFISLPQEFPFDMLAVTQQLLLNGWLVEDLYGIIVNIQETIPAIAKQPEVALYGKLKYFGEIGSNEIDFLFEGLVGVSAQLEISLAADGSLSELSSVMLGRTVLQLNASGQVLHLQELSVKSEITFTSDDGGGDCGAPRALRTTLSQWTVQTSSNVFNKLLSDGGRYNCPVGVEIRMDDRGKLNDLILTTDCYRLTSGNLVFDGLSHSLHLHHRSPSLRCEGEISLPEDTTEDQLVMLSRLQTSGKTPALWFLEFEGEEGELVVTTVVDVAVGNFTGRTNPNVTRLQLFGDPQSTEVEITQSEIQFAASIVVLGSESAVTAQATADRPGAPPTLRILGNLQQGDFWTSLESRANSFIAGELNKKPELNQLSQQSLQSALTFKEHIQQLLNTSMTRKVEAGELYATTKENRQLLDIVYRSLNNQVALDRGRYRSTLLLQALDGLCALDDACSTDNVPAVVCSLCRDLPVPVNRTRFTNTSCVRTVTLEEKRLEWVDRYRLTPVEGPVISEIFCDTSLGVSLWTDPSRGCSVVRTTAAGRYLWLRSNQTEEVVRFPTVTRSEDCEGPLRDKFTWELDHFCCDVVDDTIIHNSDCLSANLACSLARGLVYQTPLTETVATFTDLLQDLDEALMNRTLAEVQESIKLEELRAAEKEVGQLMNFDLFLSDLIDFRQARHEDISSNDTTEGGVSVTIGSISFDLTLFSKPPTTIPLEIRYSTPNCSDAIMNFNFYISSIDSSIIDAGNLLARTAVGGACPQRTSGFSNYNEYCKSLLDMNTAVGILANSLDIVRARYDLTLSGVTELKSSLSARAGYIGSWSTPPAWYNSTAADHVDLSLVPGLVRASPLLTSFNNLVDVMGSAAQETAEFADQYAFLKWLLYLETEVDSVFEDYECAGLVQCLLKIGEIVERLLLNANTEWSKQTLSELEPAMDDLKSIVTDDSIRHAQALRSKFTKIENILVAMVESKFWCEQVQDVVVDPGAARDPIPLLSNRSQEVTLKCQSSSEYPSHYQWLRDGVALPGATSSILSIKIDSVDSSGVYSCDVQSHQGDDVSSSFQLQVHHPPVLTRHPDNFTVSSESGPVFFRCNATAIPPPSWQWYYQENMNASLLVLEGANTSELMVTPSSNAEGYYICEASNELGAAQSSSGGQLQVLRSTIARTARPCAVDFDGNTGSRARRAALNSPNSDPLVLSHNLTQIIVHFLFSSESSVVIEDGLITVSDQSEGISLTFNVVSGELVEENTTQDVQQMLNRIVSTYTEFNMVVSLIATHLGNSSAIDYRSLGIDYSNITLAVLDESTILSTCPQGQELKRDTNLFCVSCPPGTRQTVAVEALSSDLSLQYPKCEMCPLGEVQPTPGQQQCLPCPTGEYQPGLGGVQCSLCPVDQYQDTTGQFVCKACPSGMGVAYTGATSMDNCTCIQNCGSRVKTFTIAWIAAVVVFAVIVIIVVVVVLGLLLYKQKRVKKSYDVQHAYMDVGLWDAGSTDRYEMQPSGGSPGHYEMQPSGGSPGHYEMQPSGGSPGHYEMQPSVGNIYVNPHSGQDYEEVTMETNLGDDTFTKPPGGDGDKGSNSTTDESPTSDNGESETHSNPLRYEAL